MDASNIHTQVSAVYSVSDAVSVVFVTDDECCVERQDIPSLYGTIKRRKRNDITVAEDKNVSNSNIAPRFFYSCTCIVSILRRSR